MEMHYVRYIFLISLVIPFNADALFKSSASGKIDFSGSLLNMTCSIGVDGVLSNSVIQLPTITPTHLSSAGATAGRTNIQISMLGCPAIDSVKAYFQPGVNVNLSTGRLVNSITADAGGAKGVELQLRDANSDNAVIKIGSSTQLEEAIGAPIVDGKSELQYTVEYYSPDGAVTPGDFSSRVEYVITYQ